QNIKQGREPSFPVVTIVHVKVGLIVMQQHLEALGLVAPVPEPLPPHSPPRGPKCADQSRRWPSYDRIREKARPRNGGDLPDRSLVDWAWCRAAAAWGWSAEAIAEELLRLSDKAMERGEKYATRTAEKAVRSRGTTGGGH